MLGDVAHHAPAVFEKTCSDLAGQDALHLVREELLAHLLDRQFGARYARWLASDVQVGRDTEVVGEGRIGIGPDAKEVKPAADLLAPWTVWVGRQREGRMWLPGFSA